MYIATTEAYLSAYLTNPCLWTSGSKQSVLYQYLYYHLEDLIKPCYTDVFDTLCSKSEKLARLVNLLNFGVDPLKATCCCNGVDLILLDVHPLSYSSSLSHVASDILCIDIVE